jgi:hypothetical protein
VSKINHPQHYNSGNIETIELIKDIGIAEEFCIGNTIKYITRYKHKENPIEDLEKARWYLEYVINLLKERKNEQKT